MTKPIAPDTLIDWLLHEADMQGWDYGTSAKMLTEAAHTLKANNRQLQLCREALTKAIGIIRDGDLGDVPAAQEISEVLASIEGVGE